MPAETTRIGMSTPDAIAMLPLPDLATLSPAQREGHVCVWSGEALLNGASVDLGSRKYEGPNGTSTVFPRASYSAVSKAAQGVLFDHATDCEDCQDTSDDDPMCLVARALYRVVRLGHR